jgi:hypothetical protein
LIMGFLEEGYTRADGTRRKDLLKVLLLNHAFYHAGTDALWKFMPSLSPFLRLLPQLYDDTSEQSKVRLFVSCLLSKLFDSHVPRA